MPCVQVLGPLGGLKFGTAGPVAAGSVWRSRWLLPVPGAHGVSLAGGPDNQVHFEGYQVSNQCMALVRDECLLPCKDAPELGYAKESSSEQYAPDVFYKVNMGPGRRPRCSVLPSTVAIGQRPGLVSAVDEGVPAGL